MENVQGPSPRSAIAHRGYLAAGVVLLAAMPIIARLQGPGSGVLSNSMLIGALALVAGGWVLTRAGLGIRPAAPRPWWLALTVTLVWLFGTVLLYLLTDLVVR